VDAIVSKESEPTRTPEMAADDFLGPLLLRNAIERAVICEGGLITSEHLPLGIAASSAPESAAAPPAPTQALSGTLNAAEREMVLQALARTANNKSKAARILGLTRAQLRSRIEKYRLTCEG
jgi:DNA-binding NtrC family response regulator